VPCQFAVTRTCDPTAQREHTTLSEGFCLPQSSFVSSWRYSCSEDILEVVVLWGAS
jgi:hypothetical protein